MSKIKQIKELYRLYLSRVLNKPLFKPNTVTLTLTSKCNLRCMMCDHWKLKNNGGLSLEEIKNLIGQIAQWEVEEIELSGGEPFMRKDIWEIISYASSKNVGMNITTNGTLLTNKDVERLFDYKINRLQISLDGIGKTQDKIRGVKGTYKKIIKNVKQINDLRKKKHSNLKINATTVIMQQNINELTYLIDTTKKLGFDSITFQPVNDNNLAIGKKKTYNPLRVKDLQELDKQIDKIVKISKKDAYIGNSIVYLESIKDYFRNKKLSKIKCYAGFVSAIITPQGRLWTCMGDYGNLKKERVQSAWKSEEANKKRRLIKKCENPCLYPCYLNSKGESLIKTTLNILKND
jgi:MoaA/NifB/PqqE/SkfB family radical SAM enzyme